MVVTGKMLLPFAFFNYSFSSKTSYVKSIDFSKLGTGNVGDFSNLKGTTIDDILSRIPNNATKREITPI